MSILAFQMPDKVVMEKADDFHGLFTFKPLEKGYGVTVGNALRRILLSSLEGYAITEIRVPGVLHEFSTINGMVEDVSELILNLKMVRFKKIVGADDIVETFIRPYSEKMWGLKLEKISPDIINRVPVRDDDNEYYFPKDKYQLIPRDGYTHFVRNKCGPYL